MATSIAGSLAYPESHPSYSSLGWIPVDELDKAVAAGFLSRDEARKVVWNRLPDLKHAAQAAAVAAAATPPPVEAA